MRYTCEEHIKKVKNKWGLFYINPIALEWGEWDKWSKYIRKEYPVQYFFREYLMGEIRYYLSRLLNVKYIIRNFLIPRQKWLIKKIPNFWCDKNKLIEIFLEECIIHFHEVEKPFDIIDTTYNKEFWSEFKKVYDWFKNIKPLKQKEIDILMCELYGDGWKIEEIGKSESTERKYKREKLGKLEEKLEEDLENILVWVVKNRNYLWT